MFHIIGERFQIERHEYEDLLPKGQVNNNGDPREFFDGTSAPQTSQFASPRQPAASSAIPPEYQQDPDLWYAIQASLGNEAPASFAGGTGEAGTGIDKTMEIDNDFD